MKPTTRGRAFLVVGAAGLGAGIAFGALVPGAAGLALLAAVALAWTTTRAPHGNAERTLSTETTREDVPARVALRWTFGPGAARVEVEDLVPAAFDVTSGAAGAAGRSGEVVYEATARAPGVHAFGGVRARFTDALGLVSDETTLPAESRVEAYPRVEDLRDAGVVSRRFSPTPGSHMVGQAGGGSEFFALREYQDGDTMRDVNWRASARTGGRLVVNQREVESQAQVTYFLDARAVAATGTARENAWADALRALASLGPVHLRRRDRPRALAYGPGEAVALDARPGDAALASVLRPLLAVAPGGERGLRSAVDAALPGLRRKSAAIVITNALDDATLADGVAALRGLDVAVTVLALDGPAFLRLAGTPEDSVAEARRRREATLDALRARGARVILWPAGERLALALARGEG